MIMRICAAHVSNKYVCFYGLSPRSTSLCSPLIEFKYEVY